MKVLIASDHAGYQLKEYLKQQCPHVEWDDQGAFSPDRSDYPDFAKTVAQSIQQNGGRGVLICGSGQGMAMMANRYPNVRAALCYSEEVTRLAREHNDANVLCMGSKFLDQDLAVKLVDVFLNTPFEGGRHARRVEKLSQNLS